ncbi:MAG TPA: hypothetical protein VGH28_18255 [Polyangiaceae bacterium]|jgi:hypothetical protein
MRSFLTSLFILTAACGGNLDVGDGPGHDGGTSACAMSDCSAYKITCSDGQPTNLQCVYDSAISGCTLTGQCAAPAATQTCTFTPPPSCSGSGPCSAIGGIGGGGEIDLVSDPTATTTSITVDMANALAQTFGDCSYYADGDASPGYVVGQPLPNEGTITATAGALTLSVSPLCDGSYPPASIGQVVDQGGVVAFSWTGDGLDPNPSFPNVPGPHAISVAEPGTLDASGTSLSRASDLALAWTTLEAPLSLEQVGFELVQSPKRLECRFSSSATSGTVPADALLQFASGSAQFRMFSVHASQTSGGFGPTTFAVMRAATFSDGPAVAGMLTLTD